jgi:AhpD family alkylhydroperoxidase
MSTVNGTVRVAVDTLAPHMYKAMTAFDAASRKTQLDKPLLELVRTRASQLNGCAYCVDLHSTDAREGGETERRLYALPVWREAPFFTDRERAALELTEAATRLTEASVGDDLIAEVGKHFTEAELAELIFVITVINAWNRLGAVAQAWPLP